MNTDEILGNPIYEQINRFVCVCLMNTVKKRKKFLFGDFWERTEFDGFLEVKIVDKFVGIFNQTNGGEQKVFASIFATRGRFY